MGEHKPLSTFKGVMMTLEKEFENRKILHIFNTVQLYLSIKYYTKAREESIVPAEILCTAIAQQVVDDMERMICDGKLIQLYKEAMEYLDNNNVDIDDFIFNNQTNLT